MTRRPRIAFVLEQTLGHVTHSDNLRRLVTQDDRLDAVFVPISFDLDGWRRHLPGASNWTIRAGWRARSALREIRRHAPLDAMFVHTQVPATLLGRVMREVPTVVSLDATPRQYDELGEHYGHRTAPALVERAKRWATAHSLGLAAGVVTWAQWTKTGLVDQYGVRSDAIAVIPPGVDVAHWRSVSAGGGRPRSSPDDVLRVLFVGGDFARKGGPELVEAVARARRAGDPIELDVVTRDEVPAADGVRVHHGLTPNSAELIALYRRAHVFCLPTHGDCLPMVLPEAGAMGLPLVSSDVGAISEVVRAGETGLLVPPGSVDELVSALRHLTAEPALAPQLGGAAREIVEREHDAATNARRLVDLLLGVAAGASTASTLLTVSGRIPDDLDAQVARGDRPRADHRAIARALDAIEIDAGTLDHGTRIGRLVRWIGIGPGLAYECWRRRRHHRLVFTDGEQVGIPYAMLTMLARSRPTHVMIGHRLTAPKKVLLFRALRLHRRIDRVVVYSTAQRDAAVERLGFGPEQVVLMPFMVDTDYWTPQDVDDDGPFRLCAVGQELRDYPTLVAAVDGLDVEVVIAAASPWSKRPDSSAAVEVPANVHVGGYRLAELREVYRQSSALVVPLEETDFQAGITSILEGMAMGLPIICTRTAGQTDTLIDGVTGIYVPPGDVEALRRAICRVIENPDEAAALGRAARVWVAEHASLDAYVERLQRIADEASRARR